MEGEGKLRPLYLFKLLYELTDEDHPLSTQEIISLMDERYGIKVHRTRIPMDVEVLEQFGYEIGVVKGRTAKYFYEQQTFELPELKLLIDAVDSSMFITEKKSGELIDKLVSLARPLKAEALTRSVTKSGQKKPTNEQIYYIVDALNRAIIQQKKVSFQYFTYNLFKDHVLRQNGEPYIFSPYALHWDGDFYYVIGFLEKHLTIANIRVDRIAHTPEILDEDIIPLPAGFDMDAYRATSFRMYNSKLQTVELACDSSVMDTIVDRFGEDVDTGLIDENTFSVTTEVPINHLFYSWIFGFCGKVKILEPREVVEEYAEMVLKAADTLVDQID